MIMIMIMITTMTITVTMITVMNALWITWDQTLILQCEILVYT